MLDTQASIKPSYHFEGKQYQNFHPTRVACALADLPYRNNDDTAAISIHSQSPSHIVLLKTGDFSIKVCLRFNDRFQGGCSYDFSWSGYLEPAERCNPGEDEEGDEEQTEDHGVSKCCRICRNGCGAPTSFPPASPAYARLQRYWQEYRRRPGLIDSSISYPPASRKTKGDAKPVLRPRYTKDQW